MGSPIEMLYFSDRLARVKQCPSDPRANVQTPGTGFPACHQLLPVQIQMTAGEAGPPGRNRIRSELKRVTDAVQAAGPGRHLFLSGQDLMNDSTTLHSTIGASRRFWTIPDPTALEKAE